MNLPNLTDEEARETIEALRRGEIDAFVIAGPDGEKVFALQGADYPYRIFVEAMNDGAVTLNAEGIVVYCNSSMERMLATTQKQIIGRPFSRFIHRTDTKRVKQILAGMNGEGEILLKRADGTLAPVHISSKGVPIDHVSFRLLVVTDLGQKKYRAIVEDQTELICRWNRRFTLIFVNDALCKFFNRTREELVGTNYLSLFLDGDRKKIIQETKKLTPDEPVFNMEKKFAGNGDYRWLQCVTRAIVNDSGEITEFQTVCRDITERRKYEEKLKESETRYMALANKIPYVLVRYDRDMKIQYVNRKITEMTGIPVERYVGKTHRQMGDIPEQVYAGWEKAIRQVFLTGQKAELEYSVPTSTGDRFYSLKFTPESGPGGGVLYVLGISIDITSIKKAEQVLKRDKQLLQRLVDERSRELERSRRLSDIGQLSATVAHELRNPLAAMTMAAVNIRRKAHDNPALINSIDIIERKVRESDQIINNLLFYSRIRFPQFKSITLDAILDEVIKISRTRIKHDSITITTNIEDIKNKFIDADPTQLSEVFSNILNNAFDAVDHATGKIDISAHRKDDMVVVSFRDNGIGIDPENLEKITQPFFTTKARGTGLGLTVSQQIVDLHGGSMHFESEKGRGTTVTVLLPMHRRGHGSE